MEAKLGSGKRFSKLVDKLKKQHGVKDAAAIAASAGRAKWGNKKMSSMAQKGKARHAK